jgi:hypothetical protein
MLYDNASAQEKAISTRRVAQENKRGQLACIAEPIRRRGEPTVNSLTSDLAVVLLSATNSPAGMLTL